MHIGSTCLIMICLLASPVQSFLLMAVSFSLAFLSSSISTYRISQSQPYRVGQTWLQRKQSKEARSESNPLSGCRHVINVKTVNEVSDIIFLYELCKTWCVFSTHSPSQFKLPTSQVIISNIGLVAVVLDCLAMEGLTLIGITLCPLSFRDRWQCLFPIQSV